MRNKTVIFGIAVICSVLFSGNGLASDVDLGEIVVSASRTEESLGETCRDVEVIKGKEIESSGARDLSEVLSQSTSVNIADYGGLGALKNIRMRGSTASETLVMIDGRPVNSPRDGEVDLSNIPLSNIDRIEVVHGPAASLYGTSAMGGVVNIITKNPPRKGQQTQLKSTFGNFHTYIDSLMHGARIAKFGYLLNADYESSGGFRANTEFNAKNINTKFDYKLNQDNLLIFNSGYYKSRSGSPGPISGPDTDDKQFSRKDFLEFDWKYNPDNSFGILFKAYNNYDRLEFAENSAGSIFDVALKKDIHTTQARGYDLQFSKEFFKQYGAVFGFNYLTNLNDSTSSAKHEYTVRAGYLENKFNFTDSLRATLGARVDNYSNFGLQASPDFSLLYKIGKSTRIRTQISRTFRAPTFNDLYWPDDGWSKGNPDLKPEKGSTAELGIETRPLEELFSKLTYYRSNYNELISWAPNALDVWTPSNVGSAVIHGVEFENKIRLPKDFDLFLGYTYLIAKDRKTHKYLIYQPRDKADFSLAYRGFNGMLIELKGGFTGKRFHNADNTVKVKQFFTLGFNLSKKFKHGFTYYLSMNNMLARKYQVVRNYPMPGFSITNSFKLEF